MNIKITIFLNVAPHGSVGKYQTAWCPISEDRKLSLILRFNRILLSIMFTQSAVQSLTMEALAAISETLDIQLIRARMID